MSALTPSDWSNQSLEPEASVSRPDRRRALGDVRRILVLFLGLTAVGCPPLRGPHRADPQPTVSAYQRSLEDDNPQAAYALLSPAAQAALPRERFTTLWGTTRVERADQREQLATLLSPRPNRPAARLFPQLTLSIAADSLVRSELQLAENSSGAWRITTPELSPVATATPEAALRALLDAIDGRNLALLLRLLSPATRQAVEDELQERAERLRAALAGAGSRPKETSPPAAGSPPSGPTSPRIEISGDRARLQYDQRYFIDLIREKDGWRIRDMN